MPTYEYACPTCGIVETFQSIKDKALTKCPQCRTAKVTRLFSGGGAVLFRGDGFWETDYNRSSDYKTKSAADGKSSDAAAAAAPATASAGAATSASAAS